MYSAPIGGYDELVVFILDDGLSPFAQGETWLERCRLFHEPINKLSSKDIGIRRDIVNGLLRINLSALASGLRQSIDEMAFELKKPSFEYGKEAARSRTDNEDVSLNHESQKANLGVMAH